MDLYFSLNEKGLIDKLASGKIVTSVNELLGVVGDNVSTNMPKADMMQLFSLLTTIGSESLYSNTSSLQITSSTLQGDGRMLYADWANANIWYFVPYVEAKLKVKEEIDKVKELYLKGYKSCIIAEYVNRSALAINGILERYKYFKN